MIESLKRQHGYLTVILVLLIVVFAFLGVIATYLVNNNLLSGANHLLSSQALYMSESGLDYSVHRMLGNPFSSRVACAGINSNASFVDQTYTGAAGAFTVTASGPTNPAATTLSGAITSTATTIPLVNASAYASSGRIMIDHELIDYGAKSGNNLLYATRGASGTTAISHVTGTPVAQYQCTLTSVGGVANLTNPVGKRTLQQAVQLPEGWIVGVASGNGSVVRWNNPTELQLNNVTITGANFQLYSVAMLSYADAWIVGDNDTVFYHWNGTAWSGVATSLAVPNNTFYGIYCNATNNCWAIAKRDVAFWNGSTWTGQSLSNVIYRAIYCNSASDCWIVGDMTGGKVVIYHWNGTSWARDPSTPTSPNNLRSVHCSATNDCWAVGDSRLFLHWNGTSWTNQSATLNANVPNVSYYSVYCNSASDCWAVGDQSTGDVMVHWNGSSWSRDSSNPALSDLRSVKCLASDDCWAAGSNSVTLHWDGSAWSQVANTAAAGTTFNSIGMISPYPRPQSAWQELYP